jgi:hypothetical protein
MKKSFLILVLTGLTGCSGNLDSRNGTWDCGSSQITIFDNEVSIEFIAQDKTVKEVGRLNSHNDIGFALDWDKGNKFWTGTSKAVFSSSKVLLNKLDVFGTKQLSCNKR